MSAYEKPAPEQMAAAEEKVTRLKAAMQAADRNYTAAKQAFTKGKKSEKEALKKASKTAKRDFEDAQEAFNTADCELASLNNAVNAADKAEQEDKADADRLKRLHAAIAFANSIAVPEAKETPLTPEDVCELAMLLKAGLIVPPIEFANDGKSVLDGRWRIAAYTFNGDALKGIPSTTIPIDPNDREACKTYCRGKIGGTRAAGWEGGQLAMLLYKCWLSDRKKIKTGWSPSLSDMNYTPTGWRTEFAAAAAITKSRRMAAQSVAELGDEFMQAVLDGVITMQIGEDIASAFGSEKEKATRSKGVLDRKEDMPRIQIALTEARDRIARVKQTEHADSKAKVRKDARKRVRDILDRLIEKRAGGTAETAADKAAPEPLTTRTESVCDKAESALSVAKTKLLAAMKTNPNPAERRRLLEWLDDMRVMVEGENDNDAAEPAEPEPHHEPRKEAVNA